MTWEYVPQGKPWRGPRNRGPVSLTLPPAKGTPKLHATLAGELCASLCWEVGEALALQMGRGGKRNGWLRVAPAEGGRRLRTIPNSSYLGVWLVVPGDLAAWQGEQMGAQHKIVAGERALLIELPWPFDYDAAGFIKPPPGADDTPAGAPGPLLTAMGGA